MARLLLPAALLLSVVGADLLLERLAWRRVRAGARGWLWVVNPGAPGGFLAGVPTLHTATTAALLLAGAVWLALGGAPSDPALGLALGGAAANLRHRIRHGGVVDYLRLPATRWAVSLGDLALSFGLAGLLVAAI